MAKARYRAKQSECDVCHGRKFIEHEHGLIMVKCEECDGTGIKTERIKIGGNGRKRVRKSN